MTYPSLLVLKASAGSGKTYSLVFHYVRLALSVPSNESHYRHILAITFTNAAAGEMKERVIRTLHDLSRNEAKPDLVRDLVNALQIDQTELLHRADNTFRHMLHHYSMLSISTIDSFNQRILRSFAFDLRLQSDFGVETDEASFRSELVDQLIAKAGEDEQLTSYLLKYALGRLSDDRSWDIRKNLLDVSKLLFRENTRKYLQKLSSVTSAQFIDISINLKRIKEEKEKLFNSSAAQAIHYFESNGLVPEDFSRGTYYHYFMKIMDEDYVAPSKSIITQAEKGSFTSKDKQKTSAGKFIVDHHGELVELLAPFLDHEMWLEYDRARLVLTDLLSLGLLRSLNEIAGELKKEKNLVFVSDFQHILSRVIADNPAPFIYERIGERYHHILFDEFQDTSELQWNNVIPLVENSLSTDRFNLIVGDGKQAIYRWRNGNARQFTHLPELGDLHRMRQPLFNAAFGEQNLEYNYRSSPTIVDFNNALYSHLSSLYPHTEATYRRHEQKAFRSNEGYIELTLHQKPEEHEDPRKNILDGIAKNIHEALEYGYRYGDIAILTRRGSSDSGPIANHLIGLNIPVITKESARLSESISSMCVMHFLLAINNPLNKGFAVQLWQDLSKLCPDQFEESGIHLAAVHGIQILEEKIGVLSSNAKLSFGGTTFDKVIQFIRLTGIQPDASLDFLLEHLRELSVNKNYSLSEIITWWDEKKNSLFFSGSQDQNAVIITTIHSSKGLEYPVVILPFIPARAPHDSKLWVEPKIEGVDLPVAWVRNSKNHEEAFDEFKVENELSVLDDLNLLYVATTRPEDRLYIHWQKKKKDSDTTENVTDQFIRFITEKANSKDESTYSMGVRSKATNHLAATANEPLAIPPFHFAHHLLDIKKGDQSIDVSRALTESSRQGRILHETLSTFSSVPDVTERIARIKRLWPSMSDEEIDVLQAHVSDVITHPTCSRWFNNASSIKSECEIIDKDGKILRPDRVVEFDEHIDVIDFKTGVHRKEHMEQVQQYMKLVGNISGKSVKGYLVYIPDMSIEEVSEL